MAVCALTIPYQFDFGGKITEITPFTLVVGFVSNFFRQNQFFPILDLLMLFAAKTDPTKLIIFKRRFF